LFGHAFYRMTKPRFLVRQSGLQCLSSFFWTQGQGHVCDANLAVASCAHGGSHTLRGPLVTLVKVLQKPLG